MAAAAITVGSIYFAKTELQNAVDAAALAGALQETADPSGSPASQATLITQNDPYSTGGTVIVQAGQPSMIRATAVAYHGPGRLRRPPDAHLDDAASTGCCKRIRRPSHLRAAATPSATARTPSRWPKGATTAPARSSPTTRCGMEAATPSPGTTAASTRCRISWCRWCSRSPGPARGRQNVLHPLDGPLPRVVSNGPAAGPCHPNALVGVLAEPGRQGSLRGQARAARSRGCVPSPMRRHWRPHQCGTGRPAFGRGQRPCLGVARVQEHGAAVGTHPRRQCGGGALWCQTAWRCGRARWPAPPGPRAPLFRRRSGPACPPGESCSPPAA